ncbi:hypothetical protein [Natronosalvus rutilus]|uniref:Uncharacterized protein n=1 Tax=Natronosalvus rutilus TaxID=2953753 RepID=A0A9E7N5T7_9EURY|nr:hypothetical protein [Natronosalvus rutilus]UTF52277.1 hypothetical protein NGM29_10775 [Natronosalvus rutilus]
MLSDIDVESVVRRIRPNTRRSPLPGHERIHGWGIMAHPFDSGHILALRVAAQNDFAPYTSVWHRSPDGAWSIYVDGPRLDAACPRYWGAATEHAQLTDVSVEWTGPADLVIEVSDPKLRWTASMDAGPVVRAANTLTRRLPESVLRSWPAVQLTELAADRLFDLGDVTLATSVPNGQEATVLTRMLFPIVDGSARLGDEDLGNSATVPETPTFGEARLPARPVFVVGGAYATILDAEEYERTVEELQGGWTNDTS